MTPKELAARINGLEVQLAAQVEKRMNPAAHQDTVKKEIAVTREALEHLYFLRANMPTTVDPYYVPMLKD